MRNRVQEGVEKITIADLKRSGLLTPGNRRALIEWEHPTFPRSAVFVVGVRCWATKATDTAGAMEILSVEYQSQTQFVGKTAALSATACSYGGVRYWFNCPKCRKRVAALYFFGNLFACRFCQEFSYVSRNLSRDLRRYGKTLSMREMERLEEEVRMVAYNGKPTKRYIRFRKKHKRDANALKAMLDRVKKRAAKLQDRIGGSKFTSEGM